MFTWNETVAIGILPILGDPELVIYFMGILKPMRRDFIEEEAREWHSSLRITQKKRWERIAKLSRERKFSEMNSSVPITCTLPFDGGMWRNSKELLRMVRYFREGFIRKRAECWWWRRTVDESISMKIKIVNLLVSETSGGNYFRRICSLSDINTALEDLVNFYKDDVWEERPYISVYQATGDNYSSERNLPPINGAWNEQRINTVWQNVEYDVVHVVN